MLDSDKLAWSLICALSPDSGQTINANTTYLVCLDQDLGSGVPGANDATCGIPRSNYVTMLASRRAAGVQRLASFVTDSTSSW